MERNVLTRIERVRAVCSWHLLIFGILCFAVAVILYAITRGTLTEMIEQYGPLPSVMAVAFWVVLLMVFSLNLAFTNIEIEDTGLTIRLPISRQHLEYSDIRRFSSSFKDRVIRIDVPIRSHKFLVWGPWTYWIIPKGGKALVKVLRKRVRERSVNPQS